MKRIKSIFILSLVFAVMLCLCGCDLTVKEYTGVVTTLQELNDLDRYKNLEYADFTGSTCYDYLEQYAAAHPQVKVKYAVQYGSQWLEPEVSSVTVSSPEDAEALISVYPHLKKLSSVKPEGDGVTPEVISLLKESLPAIPLDYTVPLLGEELSPTLTELDLSGIQGSDVDGIIKALPLFDGIEKVSLVGKDGSCNVSLDDFYRIKEALPQAEYTFSYDIFGTEVDQNTTELRFSRETEYGEEPLGNGAVEIFREILFCADNLKRLEIVDCGIDYELLAQLRDQFPEKEVVWRIDSAWIHIMTDETVLWAIGGLDDQQVAPIKYCTKLEYVDLGHNGFEDISFVRYMPNLKALILACGTVKDITPLSDCKNLEYLELCISFVDDLTPLAQCDNLQYLNISQLHQIRDLSPLYGLKNLKRVFCIWNPDIPIEQKEKLKELNPNADIDFEFDCDPLAGRWRLKADGPDEYYLKLIDIFGYPGVAAF